MNFAYFMHNNLNDVDVLIRVLTLSDLYEKNKIYCKICYENDPHVAFRPRL